ncbi:MAG: xanthine dehydrogenase family protein molybdopterin-binding subunit, partial [Alphaproteobacteria bacterium]
EPRAAVAEFDAAADRFTLHVGCQGVFGLRNTLATEVLRIEPERLRVLAGDVGGSFGMKGATYPEYAILLHAARDIGRPVKWADERSDSFLSDHHGRDAVVEGELALDEEGRILAVRITGLANMGAYVAGFAPAIPTMNVVKNVASLYRTPLIGVATRCVLTNTTPISAYRGAGRPEGNYYMERLLDAAARETGRDPVELRRGNMIPRDALPFRAGSGLEYDSGDFEAVMDACLDSADWAGFPARRAETERRGRLRGIGLACYLEVTAPPGKEMGGVRFEADGHVSIVTGTLDYGQGHASTFAQILSDILGLPFDRIRLIQGDSDQLLVGGGTGGSRSTMASGAAIIAAAGKVVEQGRALAAHLLETAEDDIEFAGGVFRVVGTDRSVSLLDLAAELRKEGTLPDDLPRGLDAMIVVDTPPSAFPNGCHIAEVEIDPETGATEVASYVVVDDFGNLINPVLVEGQVHGGVVQGLGQALMERVSYDGEGNPRSGSLMDYAVPRATHVPPLAFTSHPVPATTNPLGAKGCGEAGVTGALPAVMNAVVDALSAQGVTHVDMPATPERLWSILRVGK